MILAPPLLMAAEITDLPAYAVNPGDVLTIQVWKEQDLQTDVIVRPDSGISFPLVGDMNVHDMSVAQIQSEIAKRLKKYIPDPSVTVAAKHLSGNRVYIIGKVKNPGVFPMEQYVDVMQALTLAGGLTPYASAGNIKILRRDNDKQLVLKFDYSDVEKGKHLDQNLILKSGDVIVVP
ncbi:MAG: polysaccharide biosynthesis/export family protein [Gammaproteobacteria bacterium]|nr:polysaccharide biosynthesis/export family protein [Gammaproteobacteria bacterium]